MKLKAKVEFVTGNASAFLGEIKDGVPVEREKLATPSSIVIQKEDEGFLLLRYDALGEWVGDTWHESIEAAKAQAKFEFDVNEGDWQTCDD